MKYKSDQIQALAEALAKAQAELAPPEKNRTVQVQTRTGGRYTFHYADLGAITEAARGPLGKNGISIVHTTELDEQGYWLVTTLLHSSGQWIASRYPLPVQAEAKEIGSAITYGKRYLLSALLNISADDDNDAEPNQVAEVTSRNAQSSTRGSRGNANHAQTIHETRNTTTNRTPPRAGGAAAIRNVTPVARKAEAPPRAPANAPAGEPGDDVPW
jgi:hypothetical protein